MHVIDLIHAFLSAVIALGALAVAAVGAQGAWRWQHARSRFAIMLLGATACLATAFLAAADVLWREAAGTAGRFLALLPAAAAPALLVALRSAFLREDRRAAMDLLTAPLDPVTGLPSRTSFLAQMQPALARTRREGRAATILVAEIDDLAQIEAERGPETARDVLRDFTSLLRRTIRLGDIPGQAHPRRLAVFLPGASEEGAQAQASRLRSACSAELPNPVMDGTSLTISLGIAPVGEGAPGAVLEEALAAAEAALASARQRGGGQTAIAPPPPCRSAAAAP